MSEIYGLRNNYHIRKKSVYLLEFLLSLSFEYLQQPFQSYVEYVSTQNFSRASCNTLFVHQGNITCLKYNHPIEDVNVAIVTDSSAPIFVHASRCLKCNITFIRKEEIIRLKKLYPFLVANFCELSFDGYTPIDDGPFSNASPLMICGYNVRSGVLTEAHRHAILTNIIYNGIMTKVEIIQYLEHFINFNGSKSNMYLAVSKWENDLEFVRRLNIESHPIVEVTHLKPYQLRNKRKLQFKNVLNPSTKVIHEITSVEGFLTCNIQVSAQTNKDKYLHPYHAVFVLIHMSNISLG